MKIRNILMAGLVFVTAWTVRADEIDKLIEQGHKAYADGNYPKSVELFQQVIEKVQSRMGGVIAGFFPEAMSGWTADEIENSSWSGSSGGQAHSMINSSRTYTRDSDQADVSIQICNWPTVIQGTRAGLQAYSNPMVAQMMKQQGLDFKSEERDGWQVMSLVNTQADEAQVMAFSDSIMVIVQSSAGLSDAVSSYFGRIDLAGLDKSMK